MSATYQLLILENASVKEKTKKNGFPVVVINIPREKIDVSAKKYLALLKTFLEN